MADGAWEITKGLVEVFGDEVTRLMCWTHVYRCYSKKLGPLKKSNKDLAKQLDKDVHNLQWMCQGEEEFVVIFKLFEDKYSKGNYSEQDLEKLITFLEYFRVQWGPDSHVSRWYEGAHPYHPSHNQGLERFNRSIKDDHSYREQLNMGDFVSVMEDVVEHSSLKDASVLDGPKLLILQKDLDGYQERESLKIQELGYKYYCENLRKLPPTAPGEPELMKPGKQLEINSVDGLTLLYNKLGLEEQVKRVIILPSSNNKLPEKSLKQLAILRMQKRKMPSFGTLQEYFDVRNSCHVVEQVGSDFFCDCYKGSKGKICTHAMALTYSRVPQFHILQTLSAAKFRRTKRPVGRPRKIGGAFSMTPPRALPEPSYQQTGMEELEVQVITLEPELEEPLEPELEEPVEPELEEPEFEEPVEPELELGPVVETVSVLEPVVETVPVAFHSLPKTGQKCPGIYGVNCKHLWCVMCRKKRKCIAQTIPTATGSQVSSPPNKRQKRVKGL